MAIPNQPKYYFLDILKKFIKNKKLKGFIITSSF
jgi:hypothetical protein